MPYEWSSSPSGVSLRLWPHRSLPKRGFVAFIGVTAAMISLPLLAVLGTPVLWGLLPFVMLAVAGLWWGLNRSYRDMEIAEELTLGPDSIRLTRTGPRGRRQEWQANPYWVRVTLHPTDGPVPDYVTLKGEGREVEIGAYLSIEERRALHAELTQMLARHRR